MTLFFLFLFVVVMSSSASPLAAESCEHGVYRSTDINDYYFGRFIAGEGPNGENFRTCPPASVEIIAQVGANVECARHFTDCPRHDDPLWTSMAISGEALGDAILVPDGAGAWAHAVPNNALGASAGLTIIDAAIADGQVVSYLGQAAAGSQTAFFQIPAEGATPWLLEDGIEFVVDGSAWSELARDDEIAADDVGAFVREAWIASIPPNPDAGELGLLSTGALPFTGVTGIVAGDM